MEITSTLVDRFWQNVQVGKRDECWVLTGSTNKGYGQLSTKRGKSPAKAHRVSYTLHYG